MKEQLWAAFYEVKYSEYYADAYRKRAARINRQISIVTTLTSLSSVASWGIWDKLPWLWGSIIIASQLLQSLKQYIPSINHLPKLEYYIIDIRQLSIEAYNTWISVSLDAQELTRDMVSALVSSHSAINSKYLGDDKLPEIESVRALAKKEWEAYFKKRFNVTGGKKNVGKNTNSTTSSKATT